MISRQVWTCCRVMPSLGIKSMVSSPGVALALSMACRRDPEPVSLVVVTVKVVACEAASAKPRSAVKRAVDFILPRLGFLIVDIGA